MFYRGNNMDVPVSLIIAYVTPWAIGAMLHYVDTVLSFVCFSAFTVGILVAYAKPFVFFAETVRESIYFETNFRLSLKQMYDGDRKYRYEIEASRLSILPKTGFPLSNEPSLIGINPAALSENATSTTADQSHNLSIVQRTKDNGVLNNFSTGSVKYR